MKDVENEAWKSSIISRLTVANQEHLLKYVTSIPSSEEIQFLRELDEISEKMINFSTINSINQAASVEEIQPFSGSTGSTSDPNLVEVCEKIGKEAIENEQVGVVILSGGQGTRLGFSGPKGMVDIGLPTKQTLFNLIIQRLRCISSSHCIPLYIMTSSFNHEETKSYFEENSYFGLCSKDVIFFCQNRLPCFDFNGKILLESPYKISMAPNGNGGIYSSLYSSGSLLDMENRGIKYVHVFSIDNALVKPADPIFIGYCMQQNADVGNKVLWKKNAHEKVGVMAERKCDGKPCVVEYSDLDVSQMELVSSRTGKLVFGAANICNHFYTIPFLRKVCHCDESSTNQYLPYHIAKKKIPFYDDTLKRTITPTKNNGIKFETFIFDVFPSSERMCILEVKREEEFAPVKNASGVDSPESARRMILDSWNKNNN